jgi:undecaprenyl diphosphate synthase
MAVELLPEHRPNHLGLIADGNRRWAKAHGFPPFEGHRRGFERVKQIGKATRSWGVRAFSAWAWSTENWNRSEEEISYLLEDMYPKWIRSSIPEAKEEGVKIVHEGLKQGVGKVPSLPQVLIDALEEAEEETREFEDYYFIMGINHGGRHDIVDAIRNLTHTVSTLDEFRAKLSIETLSEAFTVAKKVPAYLINPDVIVRTGGNPRDSGYKLWQTDYSELLIVCTPLPAYTPSKLANTLNNRYWPEKRTFGGDASGNKREKLL